LIIKGLLNNKVDVTNDIFSLNNSSFIAQKCSYNYIKKFNTKGQEFNSDDVDKSFINILKKLKKNNFSESNTNEEKLKILCEKISYYSLEDLKNSEHFIYLEIRNDLKLNQNLDAFYMNIIYNSEKLREIKNQYLEKTKKLLKAILGQKIDIIEYGSYATDLSTEFSDMDILIFDEEIKDERKYGKNLEEEFKKKDKNLANISFLKKNTLIKISYDVSKEQVSNEINF
jgi:predicted nucleotidyltransferase